MNSITIETLLTILFVHIDDGYQEKVQLWHSGRAGRKPKFSVSEVMTLMLAAEYIPYPSERQYLSYIHAHHSDLFPKLLTPNQFNRRSRGLCHLVERRHRHWLLDLGMGQSSTYLLDTKPLPGYQRSKKRSAFRGSADYGYCGYKLVMVTTLEGITVIYELIPAHTGERQAAEAVIDDIAHAKVISDKSFLGDEWQAQIFQQTGNTTIITSKRKNQRIESVFHELHRTPVVILSGCWRKPCPVWPLA